MRKVYINAKVRLIIQLEDDISIADALDEMDYSFTSTIPFCDIVDSEIYDYEVTDSK